MLRIVVTGNRLAEPSGKRSSAAGEPASRAFAPSVEGVSAPAPPTRPELCVAALGHFVDALRPAEGGAASRPWLDAALAEAHRFGLDAERAAWGPVGPSCALVRRDGVVVGVLLDVDDGPVVALSDLTAASRRRG